MKYIGIVVAMDEERQEILDLMTETEVKQIYNLRFITGKIQKRNCVLIKSGIGKVNAARTTQILVDNFDLDFVINAGAAGAINYLLNIGDVVIAKHVVQHDFDITAFGHPKGFISNIGQHVESDSKLLEKMRTTINKINNKDFKIKVGVIASGDIFCTETKMKEKIRSKFLADAIEMESAAIAQVCKLDNMPFIIIRSISDNPNGNNLITYKEYLEMATKRCAQIIKAYLY